MRHETVTTNLVRSPPILLVII